jgi:hypothetical protein
MVSFLFAVLASIVAALLIAGVRWVLLRVRASRRARTVGSKRVEWARSPAGGPRSWADVSATPGSYAEWRARQAQAHGLSPAEYARRGSARPRT